MPAPSKNVLFALVILILFFLIYIYYFNKLTFSQNIQKSTASSPTPVLAQDSTQKLIIPIKPKNKSRVFGSAVITEKNGKTIVDINITGETNNNLAVHFRKGVCKAGQMKEFMYHLNPVIHGESNTIIAVPMKQFMDQFPLLLLVHNSKNVKVGCGDIQ